MTNEQYNSYQIPDRLPPSASKAMDALIIYERHRMVRENRAAEKAKEFKENVIKKMVLRYFVQNFETLVKKIDVCVDNREVSLRLDLDAAIKNYSSSGIQLPEAIVKEIKEWDEMESQPHGYRPLERSKKEVREALQEKFDKIGPSAAINGVADPDPKTVPVICDYLTKFLSSLDKSYKVVKRLEGSTEDDDE